MDEDDAGRVGIGGREEVPRVALARAVAQVEMLRMGLPERRRCRDARCVELGAVLDRVRIVVGRVAFGAAHHSPVHFALSTITIAMPAITSIVPSTSGQVIGLAQQHDRRGDAEQRRAQHAERAGDRRQRAGDRDGGPGAGRAGEHADIEQRRPRAAGWLKSRWPRGLERRSGEDPEQDRRHASSARAARRAACSASDGGGACSDGQRPAEARQQQPGVAHRRSARSLPVEARRIDQHDDA